MAYPYDLYQPVPRDLMQYYLGRGAGSEILNQNYQPTDPLYSAFRSLSTENPNARKRNPLAANLLAYIPTQMGGFTPSAGLTDMARNVVVEDVMPQDNPNYRAEVAPEAAPQRTLGLLGDMFGGASALDEYMTPEQRAQLQGQGLMAAAMQLLASSGPSRVPVGLGQALGEAYGAGQKGYTAAQQNLLTSMTAKQKMEDAKAAKAMQTNVSNFLSQKAPEGVDANAFKAQQYMKLADVYAATNPEQANKFFDMAQKLMPVSAKPEGKPEQKLVNGEVKMVQYYNDGTFKVVSGLGEVAKPEGLPRMEVRGGEPKMVQYYNDGTSKVIEGASQYNAPSTSITDLEILTNQPLAGTGAAGVAQVQDYRKSGAAQQNVRVDTGDKTRTVEVNKDIVADLRSLTDQARTANQTLENVSRVLPALDKAITGPAADFRTTLLRVGQFMGVAGKNADEILSNTQSVVQGLAQQELNAASYTKGQGTLTGPEREMLKRSAAGDQNMSAAELRTALIAAQKMAQFRINEQQEFLTKFSALPGSEQYVPFYTIKPYQPAAPAAAGGVPVLTWDPAAKKFK